MFHHLAWSDLENCRLVSSTWKNFIDRLFIFIELESRQKEFSLDDWCLDTLCLITLTPVTISDGLRAGLITKVYTAAEKLGGVTVTMLHFNKKCSIGQK